MGVERTAAAESYRLLHRDFAKYRGVVGSLYGFSLIAPLAAHRARVAYFPLRVIDDIADGDREAGDPFGQLLQFRRHMETGEFDDTSPIEIMAGKALTMLDRVAQPGDNPRGDYLAAVDGILADHKRIEDRSVLSAPDLHSHFEHSFAPVLNILLIGVKSKLRIQDFPLGFAASFRTAYSLRDLEDDWNKGEINIPAEVLNEARLDSSALYSELTGNDIVRDWLQDDSARARARLLYGQNHPQLKNERVTRLAIKGFSKSAIGYIDDAY